MGRFCVAVVACALIGSGVLAFAGAGAFDSGAQALTCTTYKRTGAVSTRLRIEVDRHRDAPSDRLAGTVSYVASRFAGDGSPLPVNAIHRIVFEARAKGGTWTTLGDVTAPDARIAQDDANFTFADSYDCADMPRGGEFRFIVWNSPEDERPAVQGTGYICDD